MMFSRDSSRIKETILKSHRDELIKKGKRWDLFRDKRKLVVDQFINMKRRKIMVESIIKLIKL
jgi:hypothetical protein